MLNLSTLEYILYASYILYVMNAFLKTGSCIFSALKNLKHVSISNKIRLSSAVLDALFFLQCILNGLLKRLGTFWAHWKMLTKKKIQMNVVISNNNIVFSGWRIEIFTDKNYYLSCHPLTHCWLSSHIVSFVWL